MRAYVVKCGPVLENAGQCWEMWVNVRKCVPIRKMGQCVRANIEKLGHTMIEHQCWKIIKVPRGFDSLKREVIMRTIFVKNTKEVSILCTIKNIGEEIG